MSVSPSGHPFEFLTRPDRVALRRAGRSTAAALLALVAADALGLDDPYWAAMTVWSVAQPTRGMLIGKCAARLAGTAIGAAMSIALLHLLPISQGAFVLALALWVSGCAALAGFLQGFRAYASLLAGFTVPLVTIIAMHQPDHAVALALSRIGCIAVGVVASAVLTWLSTPSSELGLLLQRAERVALDACRWIEARLRDGNRDDAELARREDRLIADMAVIYAQCDQGSSGLPQVRRERRLVRELLGSVLRSMAAIRALGDVPRGELRHLIAETAPVSAQDMADAIAARLAAPPPADRPYIPRPRLHMLHDALSTLALDLKQLHEGPVSDDKPSRIQVHVNWQDAARTGLRTFLVTIALGMGWWISGESLFAMALIGASILCSVFSTTEVPKSTILLALKGTALGTVAAILCTLLVLPQVSNLAGLLLAIAPFMFVGGLALADRRTAMPGMDYSMTFLLLTAPTLPVVIDRHHFLAMAPGPVVGAIIAALAFHYVLPTDPDRRLKDLITASMRDIRWLGDVSRHVVAERWRARALHRSLRLVLRASSAGRPTGPMMNTALTLLLLGEDLIALRQMLPSLPTSDTLAVTDILRALAEEKKSQRDLLSRLSAALGTVEHPVLPDLLKSIATRIKDLPEREIWQAR